MCKKYFRGVVPEGRSADVQAEMDMARDAIENYMVLFGSCRFARGLEALWTMIRACNKYIDEQAPWALKKQGEEARLAEVMYVVLECMRKAACCLTPVMPELAAKMLEQLGWDPDAVDLNAELAEWGRLEPGVKLAAKSNLFPRVELEEPAPEPKPQPKQKKQRKAEEPAPGAEFIEFGDFQKVAMRVGTVLGCERHPDADKLLVLKVDLGEDTPRTIVSGLAEHYAPDEIVGRQVIVVANLAPRKLRGVESQGMILTAESDGRLALLTTLAEAAPGAEVR
jgi:methionyl-tRNA synthetase